MKQLAILVGALWLGGAETAAAQPASSQPAARPSGALQPKVAPGLAGYTDEVLFGKVWPSPQLSQRDRSLVVISALIAMNRPAQLTGHLNRALTNGVTPVQASGVLTHLALYSGWPNAVSALEVYDQVYSSRNIDFAALQAVSERLAPLAPSVRPSVPPGVAELAPKYASLTNDVVFGDAWRRSDLTRRDRALVTIVALAAAGDDAMLEPYLRLAPQVGLPREDLAEALTHLAFYAGWPKATTALSEVARVWPAQGGQP
ncbi:carboxymuconolactone decarboxylase family protein [Phenylobacterium sp. J367]|uniref:carboxymuconolactone decarboxylase family protein n=1 Tax=Phenylobacterium sp. J367 TaxID=2898435 RepID=UPI002150E4B7|nr:carboxymuconolactone decarboxylase family protein [Phenylobacterium sp. J367]MCR5879543.1 carboxymuconolactone decarboxylase family protein [Phenylobacterium sp. J367]